MSNLKVIRPVLPANNMGLEVKFFHKMGFESTYDKLRYFSDLNYAIMQKEGLEIHIEKRGPTGVYNNENTQTIRIVTENLDLVEKELLNKGFEIKRHSNTPWKTNEFTLYSPANNAVIFQEDLEQTI